MERMVKDFKDGESYIFANSAEEYKDFTEWLCNRGYSFCYHFETGEGYKNDKGRVIEVYGL